MAVSPGFYCGYGSTLMIETKQNPVMSGPIVEFERASDRCMPNNPKSAKPFTPSNVTHVLSDRDGQMWTHDDLGRLQDFVRKRNDLLDNIKTAEARAKENEHKIRELDKQAATLETSLRDTRHQFRAACESEDKRQKIIADMRRDLEALGGAS